MNWVWSARQKKREGKISAMLSCSDSLGPDTTVYNNDFNMGDH